MGDVRLESLTKDERWLDWTPEPSLESFFSKDNQTHNDGD